MLKLPSRHIHLDFHTSEHCPAVGSQFDKANWQEALKLGRVGSINIFAKGHHGWCYYPTTAGCVHPTLKRDLLGEQIAACHEIGVKCPIYFTVGWSANDAERHPEWCVRNPDRSLRVTNWDFDAAPEDPRPICSWKFLCPSGGYLELMLAQTREICQAYDVDGFWYDITNGPVCYCDTCRAGMAEEGVDVDDPESARRYNVRKWHRFMDACNDVISRHDPDATVYYNGTMSIYQPWMHDRMTHLELEDLPTTWGGYDKFPLRSRYFINDGRPMVAMSGKFHTMWGEFGGFKPADAMKYETACMIAYGAIPCFGDQLHPAGRMDLETYRLIGEAYKYGKKIEKYGLESDPASNLGLWLSGGFGDAPNDQTANDQGTANMLMEAQLDFRVVTPGEYLRRYEAIVLTGDVRLDENQAARLGRFVADGGGLVVLGRSGLDVRGERFLIDVGAEYVGGPNHQIDYLVVEDKKLGKGLVRSPFLCYAAAERVRVTDGEVLATIREPYFDRTYATYCSHQNTPYRLEPAEHPGAVGKGRVVYLPHRLGDLYYVHGARLHRDLFLNALKRVYRKPTLEVDLPSAGRATIAHQSRKQRYVVHLLYAPPLQRGRCLVIEDAPPLGDVKVKVRVPEKVVRAYLVPGKDKVKVRRDGDAVELTLPEWKRHACVVMEY